MQATVDQIRTAVSAANHILVLTHVGPDGDALGSLTAVGAALEQLQKSATLACDDGMLSRFDYLPLAAAVTTGPRAGAAYDLLISVDCGDPERMGTAYSSLPEPKPPIINIDHHVTNTRFGAITLIEPTAVSTTEILYDLFLALDIEMNADVATSLLTGLVTDTLGFRTVGTTAKTLRIASELVEAGADLPLITERGLNRKPLSTLLLWREGLTHMKLEDGLAWTTITNEQRLAANYNSPSSGGLTNLLADVDIAAIGTVLMEMGDGSVRVGFRCRPPYNVANIATELGGGGHPLASGCTLSGPLAKAEALVVEKSKAAIRQQRVDAGQQP